MSTSKTVRFGIVGLGNMGSGHLSFIAQVEGATLTALCDIDPAKLAKAVECTGVKGYESWQRMIDSGLIDAVLIAVPHYHHGEIARYAFSKNVHVLMEKPAAVSVKDARLTNEAHAKTPHLKFGIVFQQRTSALYAKLRDLIREGELGELTRVSWIVTDWFRTHAYYASGGWRATWGREGGGVLINQCPHNLDLLPWITGLMPNRVTAVAFVGKTHPIEVEDEVSAILEYPSGAIGHFVTSTGEAPGTNRLEVCGDRGKIVAENGKLLFKRTRQSVREVNQKSAESFASIETWDVEIPWKNNKPEGHKAMVENFVRAVLSGEALIAPGEEGVKGLEIGNAIMMAGLTRKPVELPVDGDAYDRFIGEMTKQYGGRKTLTTRAGITADLESSFKKP